jgi:branched-chain amino acid transport system substrate-binding protein
MSKYFGLVLSLAMIASMLVACGAPAASGGGTIKIATQSPLSGAQSAVGADIKNGAALGLDQLSAPLKAMGFTIQIASFDDQADPNTGVANAKTIVADPSILCVVGHYNSGVQIPSSEVYHSAGLANVSPANTNPKVTDRGYLEVNRIVGRDDIQGSVGAQFAASQGAKSAYVLNDKSTYGQGIATFFQQEATKEGIKVVGSEGTDETANFDPILTPIISSNPDVVYLGGMYNQWAVLIKQARAKGYMGMFMSDDGFDSPEAVNIAGQALLDGKGTYFSTVSGPASLYPGAAKFQTDFKAKFNHDPQPFAAQAYDSMGICLQAIANAAKANNNQVPTRAAVAQAVRALKDYPGITGTINFNSKGDLKTASYYVFQATSTDPAKWDSTLAKTLQFAPPE